MLVGEAYIYFCISTWCELARFRSWIFALSRRHNTMDVPQKVLTTVCSRLRKEHGGIEMKRAWLWKLGHLDMSRARVERSEKEVTRAGHEFVSGLLARVKYSVNSDWNFPWKDYWQDIWTFGYCRKSELLKQRALGKTLYVEWRAGHSSVQGEWSFANVWRKICWRVSWRCIDVVRKLWECRGPADLRWEPRFDSGSEFETVAQQVAKGGRGGLRYWNTYRKNWSSSHEVSDQNGVVLIGRWQISGFGSEVGRNEFNAWLVELWDMTQNQAGTGKEQYAMHDSAHTTSTVCFINLWAVCAFWNCSRQQSTWLDYWVELSRPASSTASCLPGTMKIEKVNCAENVAEEVDNRFRKSESVMLWSWLRGEMRSLKPCRKFVHFFLPEYANRFGYSERRHAGCLSDPHPSAARTRKRCYNLPVLLLDFRSTLTLFSHAPHST